MHTFSKTAQLLTVALATTLGFSFSAQTQAAASATQVIEKSRSDYAKTQYPILMVHGWLGWSRIGTDSIGLDYWRSEEHTSELQSRENLVRRLLLEKKK